LFTPDEQSALAEDVVLYTGKPTKLESLLPQIHEWVQEGVSWLEIHNRTGLSASSASDYYKRWRKALAEAERGNNDASDANPLLSITG
jgi:hypothetical protein